MSYEREMVLTLLLTVGAGLAWAQDSVAWTALPEAKETKIEVVWEADQSNEVSKMRQFEYLLRDAFTCEERNYTSRREAKGIYSIRMMLRHLLYDVLTVDGRTLPFCVAPGDYLIINVARSGRLSYRMADGTKPRHERMLLHDVSHTAWYDATAFESDRERHTFAQYVRMMEARMDSTVSVVRDVAQREHFSPEETGIAIANTQLQHALWIMEYASWQSVTMARLARKNDAGWQSRPEQEAKMSEIEDAANYRFLRNMSLADSLCMASPCYTFFMQAYSHAHALNFDQYLYYGDTDADHARMDSAFVCKELAMTRLPYPTIFMKTALLQRHLSRKAELAARAKLPSVKTAEDDGIELPNIEVLSETLRKRGMTLSEMDRLNLAHSQVPQGFNILAPLAWLLDRLIFTPYHKRHPDNKTRAKRLIQKYAEDDEECERLWRAYEEVQKQKRLK